jgi:hypothetical protein
MSDWSDEETDDPFHADRRNYYKVEKWSRDGLRVELLLYAGNSAFQQPLVKLGSGSAASRNANRWRKV